MLNLSNMSKERLILFCVVGALPLILGIATKGGILILGGIGFLIYGLVQLVIKERRKKALIIIGSSVAALFLGIIIAGISNPTATAKTDKPTVKAEVKADKPVPKHDEPKPKPQPQPKPQPKPQPEEKVCDYSGFFGTDCSMGEIVRAKGLELTVLDAKYTAPVGSHNDLFTLTVTMRLKNATSKPIELSGWQTISINDENDHYTGSLGSDSYKGILFSTVQPGQSGIQTLQFTVGKSKQYHLELSEPDHITFIIVPSNPNYQPKEVHGRTWTDHYVGLVGYVAADDSNVTELSDYDRKFPSPPWYVHTVKQVGDNQFEKTNDKVSHKTKVKVISQNVIFGLYNRQDGALLVETLDGNKKRFWVDVSNFIDEDYWNYPISEAMKDGPVIATYNGKGSKPSDTDGKWVDLKIGTQVEAVGSETWGGKNAIKAKVFKQWEYGWGGVDVYFDPASLDIKY